MSSLGEAVEATFRVCKAELTSKTFGGPRAGRPLWTPHIGTCSLSRVPAPVWPEPWESPPGLPELGLADCQRFWEIPSELCPSQ